MMLRPVSILALRVALIAALLSACQAGTEITASPQPTTAPSAAAPTTAPTSPAPSPTTPAPPATAPPATAPTATALPVDAPVAIDALSVQEATATVDRLVGTADYDEDGIADLASCPSVTIESVLNMTVPDRVDDEIGAESVRWTTGVDIACIVTTAPDAEGLDNFAAVAAYRGATSIDGYIEDVAYHDVDDRSTVAIERTDLGERVGGTMAQICVVYEDEFGYCEVIWLHPEGLVIVHWTTVIDDPPRVQAMRETLAGALPTIIDDLAAEGAN